MTPSPKHSIGVRTNEFTLDLVLLDDSGSIRHQVQVPNERRYIAKLFRQWVKRDGSVLDQAVFYVDDTGPNGLPVIQFLIERAWEVRMIDQEKLKARNAEHSSSVLDAAALVNLVQRFPDLSHSFGSADSRNIRLVHLRTRRDQLMSERTLSAERLDGHRRHMEDEVQREFERMERRSIKLLNSFIQRLDMLIALQVLDGKEARQSIVDPWLAPHAGPTDQGVNDSVL